MLLFHKKDTFTVVMKKVSILGCGWLGKALAKALLEKNYALNGSVRTTEKSVTLKALGITPFVIEVKNTGITGAFDSFLADTNVLITAFPPGIRHNPDADYASRIKHILKSIPLHSTCSILHLSSIGVFGASQGEVDEHTQPHPESIVGKQLLDAEKSVMGLNRKSTIVRLGGLVGDMRHPVIQLTGKTAVAAPLAPTNLVHQNDVVTFLTSLIESGYWGHTFHCVSPIYQQRELFYTRECNENGLVIPQFSTQKSNRTKRVLDTKSAPLLGFRYQFPGCHFKDC